MIYERWLRAEMYGAKGYQRRVKRNILIGIENIYFSERVSQVFRIESHCIIINQTVRLFIITKMQFSSKLASKLMLPKSTPRDSNIIVNIFFNHCSIRTLMCS